MAYALTLDTSTIGIVRCAIFLIEKKIRRCVSERRKVAKDNRNASIVLSTIDMVIRSAKISLGDVSFLEVVSGPGPFTALRVGVVTANALAWTLHIPVYGIAQSEFEHGVVQRRRTKAWKPVMPMYGSEPNITISMKQ